MDVITIVLVAGKLLEPLWGAIEVSAVINFLYFNSQFSIIEILNKIVLQMLTFFGVVNVGVALVCAVFYYFLYAVTFNTELLFDVHVHGKL